MVGLRWVQVNQTSRRLFLLPLQGLVLPPPVQPEILFGKLTDELFEAARKALGDGADGVGLVVVLFGVDDIDDVALEVIADARDAEDDHDGSQFEGHEGDGLVGRGGAAEEINEQAALAGILIAQGTHDAAFLQDSGDLVEIPLLGQDLLASLLAEFT